MKHTRVVVTRTPLEDAIASYLRAGEIDGLAKSTLANMASHARKLECAIDEWLNDRKRWQKMHCDEVDSHLVTLYLAQCKGGEGNRGNMMAFLRNLLRYCERNDWMLPGTTDKVTHARRAKPFTRKPKVYVQPEMFPALLDAQTRHPSDRATMALLIWTLCRKSELYELRWAHVDLVNDRMLRVYRVKTKRHTPVAICPELHWELVRYRKWIESELGPIDPDWHVLPRLINCGVRNPDTGRYDGDTLYRMDPENHPFHMEKIVKRGLDAIGVTSTVQGKTVDHVGEGAHTIRRSGARAMLKHLSATQGFGDALTTVAAMLDHRDVKVTLNYIGMERQKDELNDWLKTNSPYGTVA
jgi:integrase